MLKDDRCDICCRPKKEHLKRDLQCPETTYFRPMPVTPEASEIAIRHDERKKIIAEGCIHTRKRGDRTTERTDLEAWQTAQSEWFDPTMLEIVTEYAEWRDTAEASDTKGLVDALDIMEAIIIAEEAGEGWYRAYEAAKTLLALHRGGRG